MRQILELILESIFKWAMLNLVANRYISSFITKVVAFIGITRLSQKILINNTELLEITKKYISYLLYNKYFAISILSLNCFYSILFLYGWYGTELIDIQNISENVNKLQNFLVKQKPYTIEEITHLLNIIEANSFLKNQYINLHVILDQKEIQQTLLITKNPILDEINSNLIKLDIEKMIEILNNHKEELKKASIYNGNVEIASLLISVTIISLAIYLIYINQT